MNDDTFPRLPTFEARDIGGAWDITMRIPHNLPGGGDTIEQILLITENAGVAPAEAVIAQRVCALLNKTAHIDTEDLCADGFGLHLLEDAVEKSAAEELGDLRMKLANTQREVNELKGAGKPLKFLQSGEEYCVAQQKAETTLKEILFGPNVVHVDLVSILMNAISHINHLRVLADAAKATARQAADREHHAAEPSDREQDLRDTNGSLRRALNLIGKQFGVSSSDPELIAKAVVSEHGKMKTQYSQADLALHDYSEAMSQLRETFMIPESGKPFAEVQAIIAAAEANVRTINDRTLRLDKVTSELEHIERLMLEAKHHTEGAKLWASVDALIDSYKDTAQGKRLIELAGENQQLKTSLETSRCGLGDAHHTLDQIRDYLEVDSDVEYAELPNIAATLFQDLQNAAAANKETAGQLAKADQELVNLRNEMTSVSQVLEAYGVCPNLTELARARMDELRGLGDSLTKAKLECTNRDSAISELNEFKTRALVLHDNIYYLLGGSRDPGDEFVPFAVLFERLRTEFEAPRRAIISLADNFELERDDPDNYPDAMAGIYHFIKGLSEAQNKNDQNVQTLLAERNADRAIIGAIDDLCGDKLNRPALPVVAAIRALVSTHIIATERK